jgi:hypothetical protein
MDDFTQLLQHFFAEYTARFNRALQEPAQEDVEATAGAFADCFVEANPRGVNCGRNDEQFRAMIPQGNAFYRGIGTKAMQITRIEITSLDELHAMAKVYWDSRYEKQNGEEVQIEFDVIYLLQIRDGVPRIFGYITGDEQAVLGAHGLIAE